MCINVWLIQGSMIFEDCDTTKGSGKLGIPGRWFDAQIQSTVSKTIRECFQ